MTLVIWGTSGPGCRFQWPQLAANGETVARADDAVAAALSAVARDAVVTLGGPDWEHLKMWAAPDCALLSSTTPGRGGAGGARCRPAATGRRHALTAGDGRRPLNERWTT